MSSAKGIVVSRTDLPSFSIDSFVIDPGSNVRTDYGDLDYLAKSIATNGYNPMEPLVGYREGDKIVLVDGHRRYKAITELLSKYTDTPLKAVPCILERKGTSPEERILTMLQKGSGKPLTPTEQASAIKRLLNFGWTMKDVCAKIGKSSNQVNILLDLNALSAELKSLINDQRISITGAIKLSKAPAATQAQLIEKSKAMFKDPTAKPGSKKKVLKVKDVENATKGTTYNVSGRKIRDAASEVRALIKSGKNVSQWTAVLYGLEIALGKRELDPDYKA